MQSPSNSVTTSFQPSSNKDFEVRRGEARGRIQLDWLDARFSFSFGAYQDPARNGFGALQALNEDLIQPGTGFAPHPHSDLEIFVVPLRGTVEHHDNLGNHATVRPGDIQKMRAGSGIWHSQMNGSRHELDHHLQIWLRPRQTGLAPGVEQRQFATEGRQGCWQILISENGTEGSLSVDQDAIVMRAEIKLGQAVPYRPEAGRSLYLHVIQGEAEVINSGHSETLESGDAYVMSVAKELVVRAIKSTADVLLFDLPPVLSG